MVLHLRKSVAGQPYVCYTRRGICPYSELLTCQVIWFYTYENQQLVNHTYVIQGGVFVLIVNYLPVESYGFTLSKISSWSTIRMLYKEYLSLQ